ncbi:toll/interleukin-1 receptor domain-containing protein [Sphingomonas radiodurans]|nr:toll/interleukin-1 receptor domain-containing protein [Sphingomonas radiodurans]WBH18190.1 toll/interleukin-1 receptor domain-containing protein [Sphingomonas radiodurans]
MEAAGHSVFIQSWHIPPGANFVHEMQRASAACERTIAVLSPDYLASMFTQAEWGAAFAADPVGSGRKLVPVRVRMCEPPGLLKSIVYCDLLGLTEELARAKLLRDVSAGPRRPEAAVFPAGGNFPGAADSSVVAPAPDAEPILELMNVLTTTRTAFVAQANLRDDLVRRIAERLTLDLRRVHFETFLADHAEALEPAERRIFRIIRQFTRGTLLEYNKRTLELLDKHPQIVRTLPSASLLRAHLTLWLDKYDAIFLADERLALLYVGVDEGAPFPRAIEVEARAFLERQGGYDGVLGRDAGGMFRG